MEKKFSLILLLICINTVNSQNSQNSQSSQSSQTLIIGTKEFPPFSMIDVSVNTDFLPMNVSSNDWKGYSSEIVKYMWDNELKNHYSDYRLVLMRSNEDGIDAINNNEIDIFCAGTTITLSRAKQVDFIEHYTNTGLQVMIHNNIDYVGTGISAIKGFFSLDFLFLILGLIMYICVMGFIAFIGDQYGEHQNVSLFKNNIKGIPEAITWAFKAAFKLPVDAPRTRLTTVVFVILTLSYILILGVTLSAFTILVSNANIKNNIEGYSDLTDKKVITLENSAPANYIKNNPVSSDVHFAVDISTMNNDFLDISKGYDAMIFDETLLKHNIGEERFTNTKIVGPVFDMSDLGFMIQDNDPAFHELIDNVIINANRNGIIHNLRQKYFGQIIDKLSTKSSNTSSLLILSGVSIIWIIIGIILYIVLLFKKKNIKNEELEDPIEIAYVSQCETNRFVKSYDTPHEILNQLALLFKEIAYLKREVGESQNTTAVDDSELTDVLIDGGEGIGQDN